MPEQMTRKYHLTDADLFATNLTIPMTGEATEFVDTKRAVPFYETALFLVTYN